MYQRGWRTLQPKASTRKVPPYYKTGYLQLVPNPPCPIYSQDSAWKEHIQLQPCFPLFQGPIPTLSAGWGDGALGVLAPGHTLSSQEKQGCNANSVPGLKGSFYYLNYLFCLWPRSLAIYCARWTMPSSIRKQKKPNPKPTYFTFLLSSSWQLYSCCLNEHMYEGKSILSPFFSPQEKEKTKQTNKPLILGPRSGHLVGT